MEFVWGGDVYSFVFLGGLVCVAALCWGLGILNMIEENTDG